MPPLKNIKRCLALLIVVAVAFLVSVPATAQFCAPPSPPAAPPPPPQPPCKCKPKSCKKCTTSPAYVATGIYETESVDLSIPTNGFPLQAGRVYGSLHAIDGQLGFGWSSSFHARLHYAVYLLAAPSTYQKEAQVIMPEGDHFTFVEQADGSFTPPEGRYDKLVRNPDGSFDLTLERSRSKLAFDADGALLSMTDDYGNALVFGYDIAGRLQQISDTSGSGRHLNLFWGATGRISSIEDNNGRVVDYGYDQFGMLTSVTNPLGQVTTYTYVPGRFSRVLSRITDHWGRTVTDVTWDTLGRVSSYSENGETYTYTYLYSGVATQTAKTDAAGNRWIFPFGADGLIGEKRPPVGAGASSSFTTYYSDGSVQLATNELGVKTHYTYAGEGRVATMTKDYQGTQPVRFDYTYHPDFPEKITAIVPRNPATGAYDPNWQGWTYEYYPLGSTAPGALHHSYRLRDDGATADLMASYTYDAKGRIVTATDMAGAVTDYAYDVAGNVGTVTAPANNDAGTRPVTTYGHDALGRLTSATDPLGKTTTYTYDALDRVLALTLPKPVPGSPLDFTTAYSHDNWDAGSGFTSTQVTDPNGIVTRQGYDQFGRMRRSTDGLGNATSYGYTRDLLSSITDANGNTTSYEYNGVKRLTATVFPNGARETYAYRADGLLQSRTDRKLQTVSFTYDSDKRLTRKTYPGGAYVQYTYNGQNLMQVDDNSVSPAETHTFGYDGAFRISANSHATRGTLSYTYLPGDLVGSVAVSGGPTTTYTYYPDGSVKTIGWSPIATGTFQYGYRLNGQYGTIAFPNAQTRSHAYDDQGRLLEIANAHPTAGDLARFEYGYDLNHASGTYDRLGQRVTMTASVPHRASAPP